MNLQINNLIYVFNKIDKYRADNYDEYLEDEVKRDIERELEQKMSARLEAPVIFVSALSKENISDFRELMTTVISREYERRYQYMTKHW